MDYHEILKALYTQGGSRTVTQWARSLLIGIAEGWTPVPGVRHPLGFLCLPVERSGQYGVCLHIWDPLLPAARPTTGAIHCHSWDLVSLVLNGRVVNQRVTVVDAAETGTHRIFEVRSDQGRDTFLRTTRRVRYQAEPAETADAGETYKLSAGVFHATVVPRDRTAATVALGQDRPGKVDLSIGTDGDVSPSVRHVFTPEQTAMIARRWADVLDGRMSLPF